MSETVEDQIVEGEGRSASVSDEDLRELLARERAKVRQLSTRVAESETRAERATREAQVAVQSESDKRWSAEAETLDAGISAASAEADGLEARIAALNADGSFAEAAKAARQLARAEGKIALLEQKKVWLADAQEMAKATPSPAPQQSGPDLSAYSAKQRAWIDEHPDYLTDAKLQRRVAAAHYAAVAEDIEIDSRDYFAFIDSQITPKRTATEDAASDPPPRRDSNGAVPVTRRAPDAPARRPGEVRLTPDQREAADMSMPDVPVNDYTDPQGATRPGRYRRYAENMARLRAEGRMS